MEKTKLNYTELTGNLSKDPVVRTIEHEGKKVEATFINVATWNGKDKQGKNLPAQFTDVTFFNKKEIQELKKGQRVNVKGRLSTITNPKNNYKSLSIVGYSCTQIQKETNEETQENKQSLKDLKKEASKTTEKTLKAQAQENKKTLKL